MKTLLLTTGLLAVLIANPAFADNHAAHQPTPAAETTVEGTTKPIQENIATIQSGMKLIGDMIANNKLDTVHPEIERIEPNIKALVAQSSSEPEKKVRLDAALKQLSVHLNKLHIVADAKDMNKSQVEFKKAQGALKLIEASLK